MIKDTVPDERTPRAVWIAQWCLRVVAIAFLAQMTLSMNLWIPIDRTYPALPLFSFIPVSYVYWLTGWFSVVFLIGLCFASINPLWRQPSLILSLVCFFMLILEDVNRFQPWAYVYIALMVSIAWYGWREHPKRQVATLQFVLVMVYFWSGVHKLNVQFVNDVFPWLVGIFDSTSWLKGYSFLGYSMGLFEILIALLLLLPKGRRLAVILGSLLHLAILILLVADGWNTVVYPWNIAMIALLFILFWDSKTTPYIIHKSCRPNWLVLSLFGILPFLYLFPLIPNWMALSLYSGTTMECDLVVQKSGVESCFPAGLEKDIISYGEDLSLLSLDSWGMHDLNVPPVASRYTYKSVGREFCSCGIDHDGYIILYFPRKWKNEDRIVTITCEELLNGD